MGKEKVLLFMFFFLVVLGLLFCAGFSLAAVREGYSLVMVCRLLIVLVSLVAQHGL